MPTHAIMLWYQINNYPADFPLAKRGSLTAMRRETHFNGTLATVVPRTGHDALLIENKTLIHSGNRRTYRGAIFLIR